MSEWFAYDWDLRGAPARFHVDLQYAAAPELLEGKTTLIHLSCFPKRQTDAFSFWERRRLNAVLKKSLRLLGEGTRYVGFIDLSGQRRYYFYTDDARLLVPLFEYCSGERRLKLACAKADEPKLQTYWFLLYPDAAKYQTVGNLKYIAALAARGDDLSAPRRVNLHFCFSTVRQADPFLEEAKKLGFAIGSVDCNLAYELPYSVTLHAVAPLDKAHLNELTTKAILAAQANAGIFERMDSEFVPKKRVR